LFGGTEFAKPVIATPVQAPGRRHTNGDSCHGNTATGGSRGMLGTLEWREGEREREGWWKSFKQYALK